MSDLFGNHIVGFPTRRLNYIARGSFRNELCSDMTEMSRLVRKPTMWFPNRSDTNQAVQAQERARSLKFRIQVEEELYYPSSENRR